jgi:hypothetical protein
MGRKSVFFSSRRSKPFQVGAAVAAQLEADGRRPFNPERVMGTGYNYDRATMENFLHGVARRLADGDPKLTFSHDTAFTLKALSQTLAGLAGAIEVKTT